MIGRKKDKVQPGHLFLSFQQGSEVKVKPPALESGPGMYCYQPPLQHMYCPTLPPFPQVGLGQVGNFPQGLRILCSCVMCGCICECMRAHLDGQVGAAGP